VQSRRVIWRASDYSPYHTGCRRQPRTGAGIARVSGVREYGLFVRLGGNASRTSRLGQSCEPSSQLAVNFRLMTGDAVDISAAFDVGRGYLHGSCKEGTHKT